MAFDTTQESYQELRSIIVERTDGIVFWTGSGLSVQAGLPTWAELKKELLKDLRDRIENNDDVESKDKDLRALRSIEQDQNNWRSFERLKNQMGNTSYRTRIRRIFNSSSIEPPQIYERIWGLRPHGMLTLNIDRLATKAYQYADTSKTLVTEFVGREVASYTHVLKSPHPFLCNLHGTVEDQSSWVFTAPELNRIKADSGYQNFIRACLSAKTIVFVGISADDIAVGGFLEDLSSLGIDVGEHYWFTHRRDRETSRWAEKHGVRLINYQAPNGEHGDLLEAMEDLIKFVSTDDLADLGPIIPPGMDPTNQKLPGQEELLKLDAESIRRALNGEATRILDSTDEDRNAAYAAFSKAYDEPIYRAWYTGPIDGRSELLGHSLIEEVASGSFGKVYRATDPDGNDVAVKILHQDMRRDEDLFLAFRRGVRSMKILSDNGIDGMVPYRKAYEIPAFVVMDWIDGPTLGGAVAARQVEDWELILRIGLSVANIVRQGHTLPERVLHRDIRPSNIMLRGFYSDHQNWEVVVLDFDLSWHRGALEKSVTHGSTLLGYLAPEQIQAIPGVSTRHATVDSFGLGMVLYFMLSGQDPVPDQHRHSGWDESLMKLSDRGHCTQWVSVPKRFARLVRLATRDDQSERWDMTQIQAELQRLHAVVLDPDLVASAELVAEELAARCDFSYGYSWNENLLAAEKDEPSGVRLSVQGDESQRRIIVSMSWGDTGVQGRRNVGRWIGPAMKNAEGVLAAANWRVEDSQTFYASIIIRASIPATRAVHDMDSTVHSLNRALAQLRFS